MSRGRLWMVVGKLVLSAWRSSVRTLLTTCYLAALLGSRLEVFPAFLTDKSHRGLN